MISYVAFEVPLFVPHLSFLRCLGRSVFRDYGLSCLSTYIYRWTLFLDCNLSLVALYSYFCCCNVMISKERKRTFWHVLPTKSQINLCISISICCPHEETLHPWLSKCESARWSGSSLDAYVRTVRFLTLRLFMLFTGRTGYVGNGEIHKTNTQSMSGYAVIQEKTGY